MTGLGPRQQEEQLTVTEFLQAVAQIDKTHKSYAEAGKREVRKRG